MTSFNDFGLAEPILRALAEEKYDTPTPIQAQTIPLVLAGRDVIGIAQTGTGKTAAFALPILNHLVQQAAAPGAEDLPRAGAVADARTVRPDRRQLPRLRPAHPPARNRRSPSAACRSTGRSARLRAASKCWWRRPAACSIWSSSARSRLNQVEVLVLDEADRMLDMGFIHDIKRIVAMLPKERQTLFFSATMPQEITRLADAMLRDPARVAVTPQATTVERIAQRVILTDKAAKQALLAELLKSEPVDRVLVFTRTKHGADKVVRGLQKAGISAEAIHGNKSQNQRERVLADFRNGKLRTLVATDIAARGIDVDGVSHVINYDLPNIPESYVHRIGRTARAGAEGIAISFCDHEERAFLRDIERLIRMAIPATDRRTGEPAQPGPAGGSPPWRPAASPRRHQRGNGGGHGNGHGGGHGRNGHNGHRTQAAARRHQGRHEPQRPPGTARPQAPRQEPRARASQAASEMLHSCSASDAPRREAGHRARSAEPET